MKSNIEGDEESLKTLLMGLFGFGMMYTMLMVQKNMQSKRS
jgi:hypothetical protein